MNPPHIIEWTDFDILLQIRRIVPPHIEFKHVQGHQDNKTWHELTIEANLNIKMDHKAKATHNSSLPLTSNTITYGIYVNNKQIIWNIKIEIKMINHQIFKFGNYYNHILWEAFETASTGKSQSRSIVKLIHHITQTQRFLESEVIPQIQHESFAKIWWNNVSYSFMQSQANWLSRQIFNQNSNHAYDTRRAAHTIIQRYYLCSF
jgi:hypothetical protein